MSSFEMDFRTLDALLPRLRSDYGFVFSCDRQHLQKGKCPACGKKELWTYADNPWTLMCQRENKCGKHFSVRDLYPEIFKTFREEDFPSSPEDPNATAIAYLQHVRSLDAARFAKCFSQGKFYHKPTGKTVATVRFPIPLSKGAFMEQFCTPIEWIDEDGDKEVCKQNFSGHFTGLWWQPEDMQIVAGDEVWITEAIIDSLSLWQNGIKSVAILSCGNFPFDALTQYVGRKTINWIWALNNNKVSKKETLRHVEKMREIGFTSVGAAQAPNKDKQDWNDLHCAGKLTPQDCKKYLYYGSLLLAKSAKEKGELIHNYKGEECFVFDFGDQLFWYEYKVKNNKGEIKQICNTRPEFLYSQRNEATGETRFFLHVHSPCHKKPAALTISSQTIVSSANFGKKLVAVYGTIWEGTQKHLLSLIQSILPKLPQVCCLDYIGYCRDADCYVFPDIAIQNGKIYELNDFDFFDLPQLAIKSSLSGTGMELEKDNRHYAANWIDSLWDAFGEQGIIAASFWFATLFAEQIRETQSSFPFLEIIGEAGSGKTSLLEFLWKLFGRENQEGFNPHGYSYAAHLHKITQFSNLPTVYIETKYHFKGSRHFKLEMIKPYFYGKGEACNGDDIHEFNFRGSLVIAQNEPVDASDAVLERIVQLTLSKKTHSSISYTAAEKLYHFSAQELSYFLVQSVCREKEVLAYLEEKVPQFQKQLLTLKDVTKIHVAKNYAQIMAAVQIFAQIVGLNTEKTTKTCQMVEKLYIERNKTMCDELPLVAEFWKIFDELNKSEAGKCLNHSSDPELIAVNLNEFIHVANEARQQVPLMKELRKVLKMSKARPFVKIDIIRSAILKTSDSYGKPVRCWIFRRNPLKKESEDDS